MDADREQLAIGAWSGVEDHTLRHEAEAAGSVRLGDDFFSGPGGPIKRRALGSRPAGNRRIVHDLPQGILCALVPATPRSADLRGILKL